MNDLLTGTVIFPNGIWKARKSGLTFYIGTPEYRPNVGIRTEFWYEENDKAPQAYVITDMAPDGTSFTAEPF